MVLFSVGRTLWDTVQVPRLRAMVAPSLSLVYWSTLFFLSAAVILGMPSEAIAASGSGPFVRVKIPVSELIKKEKGEQGSPFPTEAPLDGASAKCNEILRFPQDKFCRVKRDRI